MIYVEHDLGDEFADPTTSSAKQLWVKLKAFMLKLAGQAGVSLYRSDFGNFFEFVFEGDKGEQLRFERELDDIGLDYSVRHKFDKFIVSIPHTPDLYKWSHLMAISSGKKGKAIK